MEYNEANAFKAGFLLKVAQMGHTPDEFEKLIKEAGPITTAGAVGAIFGGGATAVKSILGLGSSAIKALSAIGGPALTYGIPLAITAPLVAGGALGALHAKTTAPGQADIEALRQKEKLLLYKKLARRAKTRMQARQREDERRLREAKRSRKERKYAL